MSKGDKKNIMNRRKPKSPQKENLIAVDGRDTFQTPNYAIDILVPYLRSLETLEGRKLKIWECASGLGKIVNRLKFWGFDVFGTDLQYDGVNFLFDSAPQEFDFIVTNPPFSLKRKFYEQCKGYGFGFGLLLPADYSTWIIDAVKKDLCEKIIPERRIDFVTPNVLQRIREGELWDSVKWQYADYETYVDFKEKDPDTWKFLLEKHKDFRNWDSIYDVPALFLKKYSSSYYHSMWLTRGFGLGRTETFVELSTAQKLNI